MIIAFEEGVSRICDKSGNLSFCSLNLQSEARGELPQAKRMRIRREMRIKIIVVIRLLRRSKELGPEKEIERADFLLRSELTRSQARNHTRHGGTPEKMTRLQMDSLFFLNLT